MKQWIRKMYESSVIRYIFFGGCTTMVNLVSFFILRKLKVELNIANIISIILAILFAYVVNSKYVFQDKCETLKDHVQPFCKFVSARLVTMVIEVGGVGKNEKQGRPEGLAGRTEGTAFLEAGWPDNCTYLQGRTAV